MNEFKKYKRKQIAELRPVTKEDIKEYRITSSISAFDKHGNNTIVSVSQEDLRNGSPKLGDMIARNPKNYSDQWLVAEQYFKDNFEEI